MKIMILENINDDDILRFNCEAYKIAKPFRIKGAIEDDKLYFTTFAQNAGNDNFNDFFYYPPTITYTLPCIFLWTFVYKEYGCLEEPLFYCDTDKDDEINKAKDYWNRLVCLNLTKKARYFDDSNKADAKFIKAYMSIIEAKKNGKTLSNDVLAYLFYNEWIKEHHRFFLIREGTYSPAFIQNCKKWIRLEYQEFTEENIKIYLDAMLNYYDKLHLLYSDAENMKNLKFDTLLNTLNSINQVIKYISIYLYLNKSTKL